MSGDPAIPDERDDRFAAEYALGVLPHAERRAFADRLAREPALRLAVERWQERLLPMADEIEPATPPAGLADTIEQRLFGAAPASMPRRALWPWRALAFASLAGMIVFGGLYLDAVRTGEELPRYVATVSGETDAVRLAVLVVGERGQVTVRHEGATPPQGRDYELWLIKGDNPPVSLGVIDANGRTAIETAPDMRDALAGAVLAVSDEPAGGSPTGAPTGAVLATGSLLPF
ncbi:MAG: anti-sigma factor [Roseitalea porphyridii]|jgi:anti-sigma-K factor RskA|uniref:anti-sigma factor n=1 Tax=Roseitalea porphyridii TaxID=1852022 RepID=UPI0032F083BE